MPERAEGVASPKNCVPGARARERARPELLGGCCRPDHLQVAFSQGPSGCRCPPCLRRLFCPPCLDSMPTGASQYAGSVCTCEHLLAPPEGAAILTLSVLFRHVCDVYEGYGVGGATSFTRGHARCSRSPTLPVHVMVSRMHRSHLVIKCLAVVCPGHGCTPAPTRLLFMNVMQTWHVCDVPLVPEWRPSRFCGLMLGACHPTPPIERCNTNKQP